jgi:hypothetical protein
MYSNPAQLFKGHGVTDDPAAIRIERLANGIRLTGVPANSFTESECDVAGQMPLANADKLRQGIDDALQQPFGSN